MSTASAPPSGTSPWGLVLCLTFLAAATFYVKQFVWHPLAPYPGPLLGRCSNLYAAYHAWRGTVHTDMYRCHRKYGPIVRYGPSRIVVDTNTAAKGRQMTLDIYSHGANVSKAPAYSVLSHGAPSIITLRNKEEHSWRRRVLSFALSDATITSYESTIRKHLDRLCGILRESIQVEEEPLDMSRQCDYYTFDVMSEVIFGIDHNALQQSTYRYAVKALADSNVRLGALFQAPSLATARLDRYLFPTAIQGRHKFVGFLGSLLRKRATAPRPQGGDVFSFLETAEDTDGGKALDKSQIRAECAALVVAGSDTSSTTLSATLFYLSRNPKTYRRAADEVRAYFTAAEEISTGPRLSSCFYLRSCVDEALRMSPPVGAAPWREVGTGGIRLGSLELPAGVEVGTGIYSLHHNETYHSDPFEYKPERWIADEGGSTKESVELSRSAFIPFSRGPRSCVGKGFAYHQVTLALARILCEFDFCAAQEPAPKGKTGEGGSQGTAEFRLRDHVTGAKQGPVLRFRLRGRP
ncbi:Cytochrome P450 [Metarhizium album ARSEF 1941]|uniref:Cytochrome P450 n=1 Tax=Metarhizium album (strain ARSEF 1941) TaxID=1081103 RepID=A0A0B2X680_METAS|nr:Cytochrome P450 [Metarhizium album ARSEF 1941]KHO00985.1 Cytochrome P450 [Metarhizium album ARSEF 1941]